MNMDPLFTTVAFKFSTLRLFAFRDSYLEKLTGTESILAVFPEEEERIRFASSGKLIGVKNICVTEIVGTFEQETDFDSQFRPLKKHSLERWVNAYILHEQDGWAPILVHEINGKYFVEDGHHRVSVARFLGMEFIEATVWEYSSQTDVAEACRDCHVASDVLPMQMLLDNKKRTSSFPSSQPPRIW